MAVGTGGLQSAHLKGLGVIKGEDVRSRMFGGFRVLRVRATLLLQVPAGAGKHGKEEASTARAFTFWAFVRTFDTISSYD